MMAPASDKYMQTLIDRPDIFCRAYLNMTLMPSQKMICKAIAEHDRVLVRSGNGTGKSYLAAALARWWYEVYPEGVCLISAPTERQMTDVIWRYIAGQRPRCPGIAPSSPMAKTSPHHFMAGYTANSAEAFQGRHDDNLLIIFDEATAIDPEFWDAAEGMLTGRNSKWLVLLNPLDTSCRAYSEEKSGKWHVIEINTLLDRGPVHPDWINSRVRQWCEYSPDGEIEWPINSGQRWIPGPLFESRVLGRWPSQGSHALWGDYTFTEESAHRGMGDDETVGVDVARYGEDFSAIAIRRGSKLIKLEKRNGLSITSLASLIEELILEYCQSGKDIPILIDEAGVGGGLIDTLLERGWRGARGVNPSAKSLLDYPNLRSELWFHAHEYRDDIDIAIPPGDLKNELLEELRTPLWKEDSKGRKCMESKDDIKAKLKRSPDLADAFNLCMYNLGGMDEQSISIIKPYEHEINAGMINVANSLNRYSQAGGFW
jgi:hypothetical protein